MFIIIIYVNCYIALILYYIVLVKQSTIQINIMSKYLCFIALPKSLYIMVAVVPYIGMHNMLFSECYLVLYIDSLHFLLGMIHRIQIIQC